MLCHEWGIRHSEFRSWEAEDRDLALSYLDYKSRLCQRCGSDPSDWLDERGRTLEPPPYTVDSVHCYGCVALEEERAKVGDKSMAATMTHSLRRIPRKIAERAARSWQMK